MPALRSPHDRAIAALAVPSLGALLAEPLFLATDTALVGHLGRTALGGLGVAGTILQTGVGLLIFLAYATTPAVARRLGAGDSAGAARAGIDGLWLAAGFGLVLAGGGATLGPVLVRLFGAAPEVDRAALEYLGVAVRGLPGMLVVVAATGFLRGLRDARTPLVVAVAGFAANAALNAALIYGAGLGVRGSAIGTVAAQTGMAVVLVLVCRRHARRAGAPLRPGAGGVSRAARAGGWLFLRTLTLRIAMVGTVVAATAHGTTALGATQIVFSLFAIVWLGLDALSIAGQAMIGYALGSGDALAATAVLRRLIELAVAAGIALGLVVAALSPVLGHVFTSDPAVLAAAPGAVLVMALSLPLGAVVFALDGILIGAGDRPYLALAGVLNLAVAVPLLLLVAAALLSAAWAVTAVQAVFGLGYMASRFATLSLRIRTGRWARVLSLLSLRFGRLRALRQAAGRRHSLLERGGPAQAGLRGRARAVSEAAASIPSVPLDFTAIDFETAGPTAASACSVGVVTVVDGRVVDRVGWLIRPPLGHDVFSEWNIRIHGITPDRVVDAAGWAEQLDDLLAAIGDRPVVAHNARFDMGVLRAACFASGVRTPALDYFCSLRVARRTYALTSYRLPVAAMAAGFEDFPHHDALADAEACAAIVTHAAKRHEVDDVAGLLEAVGDRLTRLEPQAPQTRIPMAFA